MISNMMETIGKMMGPGPDSQNESTTAATTAAIEANVEVSIEHKEIIAGSIPTRNDLVGEIAAMIINGRRNATDDWIEHVYSFSKQLNDELFRQALCTEEYSDQSTLQERVRKYGADMIKSNNSDDAIQRFKDLPIFAVGDKSELEEDNQPSPRARDHPLASSSSTTFQWPSMRSASTSGGLVDTFTKSRSKAQPDILSVEFPEHSTERNAVLKEVIRILRTKRPNSTENWYKACPNLAPRLEGMLYKHATSLEEYSDLSSVTERVLQFVSLGGYKKPFQAKVVKKADAPSTIVVPTVLPKLNAVFSGTISNPPPAATNTSATTAATTARSPGRPRKQQQQPAEPTKAEVEKEKPISPAPIFPAKLPPAPKDLLKLQQQRLLLLQHASKCPHGEGMCSVTPHCWSMKQLWKHVVGCSQIKCSTAHCVSSRYVLNHWCNCTDAACRMCKPAREGPDSHLIRLATDEALKQPQKETRGGEHSSAVLGDSTSKKRKTLETAAGTTSKENVVNFGDLSSPAAKRKLSTASGGGGGGGSVHSASSAASSRGSKSLTASKASSNTAKWIQRLFQPVVEDLLRVPGAVDYFGQPVDPAALGLSNYFDVVKHPMDLGTVRQTLELRGYKNVQDLVDDVNQTFENARTFNRAGTEVHNLAKKLRTLFSERSRRPRLELSAKLLQLESSRENRATGVSSIGVAANASSAPPQVSIYQDAAEGAEGTSAGDSTGDVGAPVSAGNVRNLSITIP